MDTAFLSSPAASRPEGRKPLVSVRHVSKQFANGTLAVRDVDLNLGEGEFVSLLGPSGCGKSTLLRMIAGLGAPSSGTIEWPTTSHDASGEPQRDLGFVFQDPTLMPWASALDNVMLPLTLKGVRKAEARERAAAMLALVGLAGFERSYPRELSGGMKMRVSIARGLVLRPKILLMDEPFAALDEITRHRLNDDLLELWWKERFTAVFVTHSVFESVYLSKRIVVMAARPGRVMADLDVDAPYPRDDLFRTSPEYAHLCRVVSGKLKEAIGS
ncbi:nitrate/sulfonate/bicarbonate ABC transporter ATP-binding protein [Bosea sp. AAP35]|uniref:ABC transporter ATP-binding protein n=1 Tax=Bosea sp. AAP35 TaxID=1523417 RepID=UPI0006B921E1|nr:ABC transporter ATP-binding protein [Bosea sp. AAP35]KPF65797.1 nitrate/sulfonate/bicarbonate ABC transporter ATP-binding protein [Bosea sp. AAP35]